ncbi:MAG TPA: hypothetical protein VFF79_12980 [Conexibacter sp.]|jgi:hypothetical protein|nr:hypothetical protein [Conexibacter sp.]
MTVVTTQRGETFAGYNELEAMCCPSCAVLYAVPARLIASARKRGNWERTWFCPNGHELGYNDPPGESEASKLKRQLRWAEDHAASLRASLDQSEASRRAQKAATTRLRRRVAAGVCPCCRRTFQQLTRHMASQHSDFSTEERSA